MKKCQWAGIDVEEPIYNICNYFKEVMEDKNIYSSAYDFQIFSCAVQYYLYNGLISRLVKEPKNRPATRELTTTGESFRKALRELNLTGHNKKVEIEDNNPLGDMIEAMKDDEDVVITRRKDKDGQ